MNHLNAQTQEELDALLDQGWRFSGWDLIGWVGTCLGKRDVHAATLELAVRAAMGAK